MKFDKTVNTFLTLLSVLMILITAFFVERLITAPPLFMSPLKSTCEFIFVRVRAFTKEPEVVSPLWI